MRLESNIKHLITLLSVTPRIMAATRQKSESSFLKYIGKSRAEMASMLAGDWYGKKFGLK